MTQAITYGYGRANFTNNSCTLSAFHVEPEFSRQYPAKHFKARAKPQVFPTSSHPQISGYLMLLTLDIPDGAILMLQAQHRANAMPAFDGAVFLKLRESGPNYAISAAIPAFRDSKINGNSFVVFQGRADIVGLDELEEMGIKPTRSWAEAFMNAEELEKCYDIRELSGELAPKPKIEVATSLSGKQVTLNVAQAARRVKVR